jgi:phosphatidylglycerophosphate synthase
VLVPPTAAGVLLIAAGATDVSDGRLARRRDEVTRLGFWLDGAGDTFAFGAAALAAPLPRWVLFLALARFALPWVAFAVAYLARAEAPRCDRAVSGRYPGLVLFAGLVLALFGLPVGAWLVAVGALGGLVTFSFSIARQWPAEGRPVHARVARIE